MTVTPPRTWSIPPKPEDVERVRDAHGEVHELRYMTQGDWIGLLAARGPLTEVVETEVEAAARRLRESEFDKRGTVRLSRDYANAAQDIHVVLVHVLNGGVL